MSSHLRPLFVACILAFVPSTGSLYIFEFCVCYWNTRVYYEFIMTYHVFSCVGYLTMLSVSRIYRDRSYNDKWEMNRKRFGKKLSCPNRGTIVEFVWRDWGKLRKTSARLFGVLVVILTEHLSKISLKYCLCTSFFGNKSCNLIVLS
jgi:hypothetical protein